MITSAIEIRQWNKERIRAAIQKCETCTKADIVKQTDLSMATCSTALNEMLESREILKVDQVGAGIGRPSDLFSYNRDYLHVLCLCFFEKDGANIIELAVADALGQIISRRQFPMPVLSCETIDALVEKETEADPLIRTVGIGIPGVVADGVIESCDIKPLEQIDFAALLSEKYHVDVIVKNDMNIITYHLYHSQVDCTGNFAALYFPSVGTGYVGSGFIVDGHALHGSSMLAGEIFHIAEAFGISLAEQESLLSDRDAFRRFAAQLLTIVCCTINPSNIVIMGNDIDSVDVDCIRIHCSKIFSARHMPTIQTSNNMFESYCSGMIRQTLDSILFPFLV